MNDKTTIRDACGVFWRGKNGSAPIWMFGLMAVVLAFAAIILETGTIQANYSHIESVVQSSVACAVEQNMLDEYRQDGVNMMDVAAAKTSFSNLLVTRLGLKDMGGGVYKATGNDSVTIKIDSVTAVAGGYPLSTDVPTMTVKGSVSFNPILKSGLTKNVEIAKLPINVTSTNFRTDGT